MFGESRILLERYFFKLSSKGCTKRAEHLLQEVRERLRNLEDLYSRIESLVIAMNTDMPKIDADGQATNYICVFADGNQPEGNPKRIASLPSTPQDKLKCDVEYFYYSAHRIKDIISDSKEDLPGLNRIKAKGVTLVRNKLVEHPSEKDGEIVPGLLVGPDGPRLRPLHWNLDKPGTQDAGLSKNADEFEHELNTSLKAGIHYETYQHPLRDDQM